MICFLTYYNILLLTFSKNAYMNTAAKKPENNTQHVLWLAVTYRLDDTISQHHLYRGSAKLALTWLGIEIIIWMVVSLCYSKKKGFNEYNSIIYSCIINISISERFYRSKIIGVWKFIFNSLQPSKVFYSLHQRLTL